MTPEFDRSNEYEFTTEERRRAYKKTGGYCECCGKKLVRKNKGRWGRGSWEAHHGNRNGPVILCTGGRENCHLNCGHGGDWNNIGITPRVHKGGSRGMKLSSLHLIDQGLDVSLPNQ